MILVNGDSFTYGEELNANDSPWPDLINGLTVNIARPGYSNDAIVRSTVRFIEINHADYVIVAWTTPHRIEVNGKHLTPTSHRKYGSICDQVFLDWDEEWAVKKFYTQVALLDGYLKNRINRPDDILKYHCENLKLELNDLVVVFIFGITIFLISNSGSKNRYLF